MPDKKTKEINRTKRIAIVRVRGRVHVRGEIEDTLKLLNLKRVNHCVVIDDRPQYKGMIGKINDYVTWGEIEKDTLTGLLSSRGILDGNIKLTDEFMKDNSKYASIPEFSDSFMKFKSELKDISHLKHFFRLSPPEKGYERGGIKHPYSTGGALGYRGNAINDLLNRMMQRIDL